MIALAVAFLCVTSLLVWRDVKPLLARLVAVHEQRHAPPKATTEDAMPDHLIQMANAQGAEWARDDLLAAMRESYAETGDWTKVASHFTDAGRTVDHMRIAL